MKLDFSAFEKALMQLEKSLSFLHSELAKNNSDLYEQFRAAVIQAFEYTFELSIKMLRRQLEQIVINPGELREMVFMDFIRTAYEAGLVHEVVPFKIYRELRNITSHTYDGIQAEKIIAMMEDFRRDMEFIINELRMRNQA